MVQAKTTNQIKDVPDYKEAEPVVNYYDLTLAPYSGVQEVSLAGLQHSPSTTHRQAGLCCLRNKWNQCVQPTKRLRLSFLTDMRCIMYMNVPFTSCTGNHLITRLTT